MNQATHHYFLDWCKHQWPAIVWMGVWSLVIVVMILTLGW